jgi:hypothetical protein
VEMIPGDGGEPPPASWSFQARGGGDLPVEIDIRLPTTGRLAHLHAVSFSIAYPAQALSPMGSPIPGPLLAEEEAPARVDFSPAAAEGRLQVTIARTGLGGDSQAADADATLVTLRWQQLLAGAVELRLEDIQVLDADFSPVPLPGGVIRISTP